MNHRDTEAQRGLSWGRQRVPAARYLCVSVVNFLAQGIVRMEMSVVATASGQLFDLVGALIVASGVWRSRKNMLREFVPGKDRLFLPDYPSPKDDPDFMEKLREVTALHWGMIFVVLGFALQLAGTLLGK